MTSIAPDDRAIWSRGEQLARTSTGVRGLDALLEGGFPAHRAILVSGAPGTGKTTLALQFLAAGIQQGEAGVCVSVDQKPQHLLQDAARFGWDLDEAASKGLLTLLDASPFFTARRNKSRGSMPVDARNVATDLSQYIRKGSARRLVIDSLTSLVPPDMTRAQAHDYLRSIILSLEDNVGCTVLLTSRACSANEPQAICEVTEYLVSGILDLAVRRDGDRYVRTLYIKKMRGTAVQPEEHPLRLDARGLQVLPTARHAGCA
jgi:circadian clock protein KaiC